MSPTTRTTAYLAAVLALLAAAWACTGGSFAVGNVRERGSVASARNAVQALKLEFVTSFIANDSPSPVWSPSGQRLAYSERNLGRIFTFTLGESNSRLLYDASSATAQLPDIAYNVDMPAFLGDGTLISGPTWASTLDATDTWGGTLHIDTSNGNARAFGADGRAPQVNAAGDRILLELADGIRLTDANGNELAQFRNLYSPRWAPHDNSFIALQFDQYYGDKAVLVHVAEDGTVKQLQPTVYEPVWHPEGKGIAFSRGTAGRTWYDPSWEYGSVQYYDLETGKTRPVADHARSPVFVTNPTLLLYDSMNGIGVTDLQGETRVLRDVRLSSLRPSPDGTHLAGVRITDTNYGYYPPTMEVVIYALTR